MRRKLFFGDSLLLWAGFLCFLLAGVIHQSMIKPTPKISKQDTALNINKDLLVFLSAGNKRFLTDLLWVQTLIESDLDHYANKDLNSWMYVRFRTIAELDPMFYQNYVWGGQYLSIVKDDLLGAVALLSMGLEHFPDDYRILSMIGFIYYFELGDYTQGLAFMERIQFHPKAPPYFPTIVMKLKAELGQSLDSILLGIQGILETTTDERLRRKLETEIYAVKAERDITCLNAGRKDCSTTDARGAPYVRVLNKFFSRDPFLPYRLKRKGDQRATQPVHTI